MEIGRVYGEGGKQKKDMWGRERKEKKKHGLPKVRTQNKQRMGSMVNMRQVRQKMSAGN